MELQRLIIQNPMTSDSFLELEELIPVFHRWIQEQLVEDHLLIDVGDYLHLTPHAKILLVAHEATIAVSREKEGLCMQYQRRRPIPGRFSERLAKIRNDAEKIRGLLEREPLLGGRVRFREDAWRILPNDRLWVETAREPEQDLAQALRDVR